MENLIDVEVSENIVENTYKIKCKYSPNDSVFIVDVKNTSDKNNKKLYSVKGPYTIDCIIIKPRLERQSYGYSKKSNTDIIMEYKLIGDVTTTEEFMYSSFDDACDALKILLTPTQ